VDRIANSTKICIKDEEVDDVSSVSAACNGANEFLIDCNGITTADGYTCSIVSTYFNVTGLKNSVVVEYVEPKKPFNKNIILWLIGFLVILLIVFIGRRKRKH